MNKKIRTALEADVLNAKDVNERKAAIDTLARYLATDDAAKKTALEVVKAKDDAFNNETRNEIEKEKVSNEKVKNEALRDLEYDKLTEQTKIEQAKLEQALKLAKKQNRINTVIAIITGGTTLTAATITAVTEIKKSRENQNFIRDENTRVFDFEENGRLTSTVSKNITGCLKPKN